ncbi:unnamed protein product [Allacma fusca]|uniref:Alkaline phosphatase n=1 Tax=Allacma fusca TaxID=39272 RepID=A0A8J2PR06_9HEXA|nr:unnamed protein product [Allacma fusca]
MKHCGLSTLLGILSVTRVTSSVKEDSRYWKKLGEDSIKDALREDKNENLAKNVILFVGDGMGLSTIVAGRIFKGQMQGHSGEEGYLSFEKFKHVGLLKTYNVDRQVPDSAGTATALFSGIKGNYYAVGLDATSVYNVCQPNVTKTAGVRTLIDWAIEAGKSTGMVTTTRLTHATPASSYAHCPHRDWECDTKIPETERGKGCKDIASQMVEDEPGRSINVLLGGGEQVFVAGINKTSVCTRGDGKNLPFQWMKWHNSQNRTNAFVKNKAQLMEVPDNINHVLGLFAPSHMPYDKDRDTSVNGEPSLEEMTTKAIQILSKNTKGYVLLVEGGRIDHAHHDNLAKIAMEEVAAFDAAIQKALAMTKRSDTLIVVTADHSHAFTINGYPKRGNPIEGVGDVTPEGFAYETLSYINGPGYNYHRIDSADGINRTSTLKTWKNLNLTENAKGRSVPHMAGFWMDSETHGGEDVPVYASGPMAHLIHGVHEQTHVPYTIAYSLCIGPYFQDCRGPSPKPSSSTVINISVVAVIISTVVSLRLF